MKNEGRQPFRKTYPENTEIYDFSTFFEKADVHESLHLPIENEVFRRAEPRTPSYKKLKKTTPKSSNNDQKS